MVDDHKVQFNLLHVGSTIKKSFKFIRNHQLRTLETYWNKMKTDKDRMQIKDLINDIDIMTEFNKPQKEDN
ncbi:hypothetical protein RUM44_000730 [Polyplax serrata]|uniref:Uncharacterized protein n=1 Tax=Polyplax serrata TaxID=468196 RepID=A0ABR1B8I0_POLSC